MSTAVCGKRSSSFFDDQQHPHPHAGSPPPAKRIRFRAGVGTPSPLRPPPRADPVLVVAVRARFPALSLQYIENALQECGNDLDSATKCLLKLHAESAECDVANGMSTDAQLQVQDENELAPHVDSIICVDNLPSSSTQWVDAIVKEMASASTTDDAKARALRVLEAFGSSMASRVGAEAYQSFQKETLVYKEQLEAVIRENTILKKAVAIQHERQKEHDERSQEFQQLKQLVVQYQEQVRNLEVNNYALSMHLRQAQQGSSIPGHFNRDIF